MMVIDGINEALNAALDFGLIVQSISVDGDINRVPTKTSQGQKDGWYCFFRIGNNGHVAGSYGQWREGGETIRFRSWEHEIMPASSRAEYDKIYELHLKNIDELKAKKLEECIAQCVIQWGKAEKDGNHAYLEKKGLQSLHGARILNNLVLIPVCDTQFNIKGLQKITASGSKFFEEGSNKKGNGFLIGKLPTKENKKLYFCEGFATGASASLVCSGVVVCIDAGNIEPVITNYREIYSIDDDYEFIILADSDSVGLEKAQYAAGLHDCRVIYPVFKVEDDKKTDFNDLHQSEGVEELKLQIIGRESRLKDAELPIKYLGDIVTLIESGASQINRGASIHGAIAFIAHCVAKQVTTSAGDKCSLFVANSARSMDSVDYVSHGIDAMLNWILMKSAGQPTHTVRVDRLTCVTNIDMHYAKHDCLLYLPDDIAGMVTKRNYQSSGALDGVLAKLKQLHRAGLFSFNNAKGERIDKEYSILNIYANFRSADFFHFSKTSDNGFLGLFITNITKDGDYQVNRAKRKGQITNAIHAQFLGHAIAHINRDGVAAVIDYEYDPAHYYDDFMSIVDDDGRKEFRAYIENGYDLFKRLSAIVAFWNSDTVVSRDVMESCAGYVCSRLKTVIDELEVKKTDDITQDVRARVLDTIYRSGDKGIGNHRLVASCALFRKMTIDERNTLISALLDDGQIKETTSKTSKLKNGDNGRKFFIKKS